MEVAEKILNVIYYRATVIKTGPFTILLQYLHVCAITTQESTLDYLHMVCGQSVALFKGLLGDCQMFDYLTDTSTMPTEVISVSQGDLSCPIGFCNFDGDVWINSSAE